MRGNGEGHDTWGEGEGMDYVTHGMGSGGGEGLVRGVGEGPMGGVEVWLWRGGE